LPCFAIDRIQWRPAWVPTPEPEYTKAHEELLSQERWLIDGYGSWASVERRLEEADTIIFVDHPIWVHFWWATKRQSDRSSSAARTVPKAVRCFLSPFACTA